MSPSIVAVIASIALCACGRLEFDEVQDMAPAPDPLAVEVARFKTTSMTFVDVPGATLTIPPSVDRTWLLLVSATLQSSTFGEVAVEARYLVDGIERGLGGTQASAVDRPGPWQHFYVHEGGAAPTTITVQLRDALGGTAAIEDLSVIALPLPDGADPLYASADPIQLVSGSTFVPLSDLVIDPAAAGDYLVLLLSNTSDAPAESDVFSRWLDPAGQPWTGELHMPRTPWQSNLFVRGATLGPDPVTITFEGHATGATGQVQYVRVLAIRTDALASFELASDELERPTTSAAITLGNQLAPQASAARYLYLASARVEADCNNTQAADRGIHFVRDDTVEDRRHVTDNCAYMTTYGISALLTTRPDSLGIGFSSGNGELVHYQESSILLVGLD